MTPRRLRQLLSNERARRAGYAQPDDALVALGVFLVMVAAVVAVLVMTGSR